jgi:hypothetical protein
MTEPNTPQAPAGWYPNPANPTGYRFWDGERWTEQEISRVADAGWHPDPSNPGGQRYWDGRTWTDRTRGSATWFPSELVIGLAVMLIVVAGVASAFVFHSNAETGCVATGSGKPVACGASGAVTSQEYRVQQSRAANARRAGEKRKAICEGQVGGFLTALQGLRSRLFTRIRYAEYSNQLRTVRGSYDRISFGDLAFGCLSGVALPAESAMNSYVEANVRWNDCITRVRCDTTSVIPTLQQRWRNAAQSLRAAQGGLSQLAHP